MLLSFTTLLPLAALLPRALSAPSPHGVSGLAVLAGVVTADAAAGTFDNSADSPPDDAGYDPTSSCTYNGPTYSVPNPNAWQTSMTGCLDQLNASNWNGAECSPVGGVKFGFYKGNNDYSDPVDCFNRCSACLLSAISANSSATTKCQYEYKTRKLLGVSTHTCTMGYQNGK